MKKKRWITRIIVLCAFFCTFMFAGCASCDRELKSCKSDINGGLQRTVNVYSLDGKLLATHKGLIDIDDNANGSIMFDMNGKRYVYYNAIIEVIEE